MNKKNTKKLFKKYPKLFAGKDEPIDQNLMSLGFDCGDGWYGIIDALAQELTANKSIDIRAFQVKEKWGGLRFYVNSATDEQFAMIDLAEAFSYRVCEACGKPGKLRQGGWIVTLCEECNGKRKQAKADEQKEIR